ncbi:hypothetical protein HAX54_023213, partial [Datura stramonium]|nr:hypothetical protein [Datura stramonium]
WYNDPSLATESRCVLPILSAQNVIKIFFQMMIHLTSHCWFKRLIVGIRYKDFSGINLLPMATSGTNESLFPFVDKPRKSS